MFKPIDSKTDFPLMEKKWLRFWYEKGVVQKYLNKNKNSKKYFSFLDGPITANNPMGVHHAWGRTYKDLWQRFYNLLGYKQRFQNGFDCQGLWVEVEVEKQLGIKTKKDIENLVPADKFKSIDKFVSLCKERVRHFAKIQTDQSKRLGYFMDWDNSYYTMSDENNYMIWYFLKKCYENGWIYKGKESVPWCPRCETAISEHEILTEDYKEIVHEAVYFKLKICQPKTKLQEYLLVWTTTPWTIPANIAVAVNENFNYCLVETKKGEFYWLAKDLIEKVLGEDVRKIIKEVKGKNLVGFQYLSPFDELPPVRELIDRKEKIHLVVATDERILSINLDEGTGLVHTAVSAGTEDYRLGKKLGLSMIPIIADNADYLSTMGFLAGKNAKKNPKVILDYLEKNGWVYKIHHYKHRYPVCWRCKSELVWKVADEWYIAMDKKSLKFKHQNSKVGKTLREMMIEVAKKIRWIPEFGLERELDWLKNMHDWLISKKNRYWGLSLPIYQCNNCGYFEIIGGKEELKKRAIVGWERFEGHSPHKPWIDEVKIKCNKCREMVSRISDVGNPWLDAGIVAYSTIAKDNKGIPLYLVNKEEWKKWFPVDFITESFPGQFKNWFYSLIAMSTVLENRPPFKTVLGFGTLLGEDGRPMHKSWGNAIEFNEGADKIGVDVMRWMYAKANPVDNLLFGYKRAEEVRRLFYLMFWNIYRFFIEYINLDKPRINFKNLNIKKIYFKLSILDRWILSRFVFLINYTENSLKNYDARLATIEIEKFIEDLSTWYIRRSRERVWVNSENNKDKKVFYSTLYFILVNLSVILSPFLPFITEEVYKNLTDKESVHLEFWPQVDLSFYDKNLETQMSFARKIVELGHAKRKQMGVKVRIPLAEIEVDFREKIEFDNEIWKIIISELNVKNIILNGKQAYPKKKAIVDKKKLEEEGELREVIRKIQALRKEKGLKPIDKINVKIPLKFKPWIKEIKKKTMISKVIYENNIEIL